MARAKRKSKPSEPLVNRFAANHGDYREATISVTAGELEGEGHGQKRVTVNRGGTTLNRWLAAGSFSPTQANAVDHYAKAWRTVFSEGRVTANLSPMALIRSTGDEDGRNAAKGDALDLLKRRGERIFDRARPCDGDVWKDVVIFDRASFPDNGKGRVQAKERALTICLFIADMIATELSL
jgi:hypothetical protein